jgi:hypothetical protein
MLEPHLSPVPIQLPRENTLLEGPQKLVVYRRHLKVNQLFSHHAEIFGRLSVLQIRKALLDELADDVAHLPRGILDANVVRRRRERLLELGDRVLLGDGCLLPALAEEGVDVEPREGFDRVFFAAFGLGFCRD